jgi:hypothetical protein
MHTDTFVTYADAVNIATVIHMCQRTAKVSWVEEGGFTIWNGHTRSIDNIRDNNVATGEVRITMQGGMEHWKPISEVVDMIGKTTFAEYDWS